MRLSVSSSKQAINMSCSKLRLEQCFYFVLSMLFKAIMQHFHYLSRGFNLWLKYILFTHVSCCIFEITHCIVVHIWIGGYFMKHRWYKVKSLKLFPTLFLFVSSVVLCTHKDIFWTMLAMQHETLCAEHISFGYPRAGASLNTSHKPFTTWWGKLLPLQSPLHRLKYHCMPRHKPLERTRLHAYILFI